MKSFEQLFRFSRIENFILRTWCRELDIIQFSFNWRGLVSTTLGRLFINVYSFMIILYIIILYRFKKNKTLASQKIVLFSYVFLCANHESKVHFGWAGSQFVTFMTLRVKIRKNIPRIPRNRTVNIVHFPFFKMLFW